MERKLFGTDGIRGKANVYPVTCEMATLLGRVVTQYFYTQMKSEKRPLIIVGKDTRLSCYMLEMAFAAGVCSQGGKVILTGPLPTPGVAFVTESMRADAGIMISASHNAYYDNGIKIFDSKGNKLPDEVEQELERLMFNPEEIPVKLNNELGSATRLSEVFGRYIVHVKSTLPHHVNLEKMRIVLDCANGATYKVAPMIFEELGAEVITVGTAPNGENINKSCGSLFPQKAKDRILQYRADIGLCFDGDGDRLTVIDRDGAIIDGDKIIGICARLLLHKKILKKSQAVIGTVMTNLGLEKYLEKLQLKLHRTQVGDRYIVDHMRRHNNPLGGEPSGHIIFSNHSTTGDGILAGLKIIEAMQTFNMDLKEMCDEIELYPQILKNIPVKKKIPFDQMPIIAENIKAIEKKMAGKGRILLRYSGTESLARIMVEGEHMDQVLCHSDKLTDIIIKELS